VGPGVALSRSCTVGFPTAQARVPPTLLAIVRLRASDIQGVGARSQCCRASLLGLMDDRKYIRRNLIGPSRHRFYRAPVGRV
jgi:hypothetical protein